MKTIQRRHFHPPFVFVYEWICELRLIVRKSITRSFKSYHMIENDDIHTYVFSLPTIPIKKHLITIEMY